MKTCAIDLDGTLAEWEAARAEDPEANLNVGRWMDGALAALLALREAGHEVLIHTCRATWDDGGGFKAVAAFLRSGGFVPFLCEYGEGRLSDVRFNYVYPDGTVKPEFEHAPHLADERAVGIWYGRGKPVAHIYLDDRAFDPHVEGWEATVRGLLAVAGAEALGG